MKDIAILTKYYKNYNYGGMLQGYALYTVLTKLGYSVDIISYDVNLNKNSVYPNLIQQIKQYGISTAVPKVAEKIIAKGKFLIDDVLQDRIQRFNEFENQVKGDTELYNDDSINKLNYHYKVFISGSDQVWNPNAVRNLYLQTFVSESYRKVSYAASIGRSSFSDYEANIMIPAIEKFGNIGIRENTAKKLLEHYINNKITTVLDPTLLLSANEWAEIATKRIIKEKYALVYFFSDSLKVRKKAQEFCKKHGLTMIVIPYAKQEFNLTDVQGPGKRVNKVGPKEFVSLIKYADFVFTDSFHGAVFSLIHQIPFAVFERNKSGHVSMNSRLYDLLDIFNQRKRLINIENFERVEDLIKIEKEKIIEDIEKMKDVSIDFLHNSINYGITEYDKRVQKKYISGEEHECSGCGECIAICPQNCITFKKNKNGFLVPFVNDTKCVQCGLCKTNCSMNHREENKPIKVCAVYSKEEQKFSASGGIGYTIAQKTIKSGGIVYGAAYTDKLNVEIIRCNKESDLIKIQGTKYVQANMEGVIEKIITDLKGGEKVLFMGTPCQVAGVIGAAKYFKVEEYLTTVEVICHGVPSQKMFDDYLEWAKKHYGKKIIKYSFRHKESDKDKDFMIKITLEDGKNLLISGFKDPYYKAFLSGKWFRETCYNCPHATANRNADVTIGDFWNSEQLPEKFGKNRRISVFMVNSNKGKKIIKDIKKDIEMVATSWNIAAQGNSNLYKPTKKCVDYVGYGEMSQDFFECQYEKKIDVKKYIINQFPIEARRNIKKFKKH